MSAPDMMSGSAPGAMDEVLDPTVNEAWALRDDGFDLLRETGLESRYAISNGFLGVRATRTINRVGRSAVPPRTYVAGLFDTSGVEQPIPTLIPAADWLQVRISISGEVPVLASPVQSDPDMTSHQRMLDLGRGMLHTGCRLSDGRSVRVGLRTMRLVSMAERSIGLQLMQLAVTGAAAEVCVEAWFDGLELGLVAGRVEQDLGIWHTRTSGRSLAIAAAATLRVNGHDLLAEPLGRFRWAWRWQARPGQVAYFERMVAITRGDFSGPNAPCEEPGTEARRRLGAARRIGWRGVAAAHEAAWAARWRCSDVEVEGDPAAQQALRFAGYHLNGAANPDDERVSIAARGLTGDDYRGHVFWDTEIFLLPFYSLTWPEAARAMLLYRFHTLDAARAKAARLGWRGALYAWESADTGEETTPEHAVGPDRKVVDILCGTQEQHIAADVAHAVWQYWQASADERFLREAGAEILLETARFWASRAGREADGACHIRGVIGPDEYHEHIDDNAFTNVMARRNIGHAVAAATLLRTRWPEDWARLSARLSLDDAELAQWSRTAGLIATGLDRDTGLFEQFAGYFALEPVDLAQYAGRSVPMDVVLGRERTARSQVVKQADVVALLALLPDEFAGEAAAANFAYYEPRCSHGSSLSHALHGLAAARLGLSDQALAHFRQTAAIDLGNGHAATDGGVHIAAVGGVWLIAVFGFAGLSLHDDHLAVDPRMPAGWSSMSFAVQWRGRHLRIKIRQGPLFVQAVLEAGEPMTLMVCGQPCALHVERLLQTAQSPGPAA